MLNLLLSNSLAFLILTVLGNGLLEIRDFSKRKHILLYVVFVLSLTLMNGDNVNLFSTLKLTIGYIAYLVCYFKDRPLKIIIVFLVFVITNLFSEILSSSSCYILFDLSPRDISTWQYTFAIVLSQILNYCFVILEIKMIKFSYWGDLPKYTYLIVILPISTFLLLVCVDINYYYTLFREQKVFILAFVGLVISNFVTVFIFLKTVSAMSLKKELEMTKLAKKNIDLKYELLNSQHKANYSFMHDSIRTSMKIQNLLDKGEYEQFKQELLDLNERMLKRFNMINRNLSVVSPIVNFRLKEMLEKNIDFKSFLEYNDFTFLDIYEQRSMFDILIEIGMLRHGNDYDKAKEVILKAKKINNQVVIQLLTSHENIENTNEFISLCDELSKIIHNHQGKLSFEVLNDKSDSLVIVFNS